MEPIPRALRQLAPRLRRAFLPAPARPPSALLSSSLTITEGRTERNPSALLADSRPFRSSSRAGPPSTVSWVGRWLWSPCVAVQASALSSAVAVSSTERRQRQWDGDGAEAIRSSVQPGSFPSPSTPGAEGGGGEEGGSWRAWVPSEAFEQRLSVSRRLRSAASSREVAEVVEEQLWAFDDRNTADAVGALARLGERYGGGAAEVDEVVHVLCGHLLQHAASYRAVEVVRACTALLRHLRHSPNALVRLLEHRVAHEADALPPRHLRLLLHTALDTDGKLRAVVDSVAAEVARRDCDLPTRELVGILKALAQLKYSRRDLLAGIAASAAARQLPWRMSPSELGTAVWALGRLRVQAPAFYDAAASRVRSDSSSFDPFALSTIALGLSNARHACESVSWALASDVVARPLEYSPTSLANVAYACGGDDPAALSLLRPPVLRSLEAGEMAGPEVVRVALAFSRGRRQRGDALEEGKVGLFAAVATALTPQLGRLHSSQLANALWAFAKVGIYDGALFDAALEAVGPRVATLRPQCLATLLWSLAKVRHASDALLDEVADTWGGRLGALSPRGLSMLAYSYAMLQPQRHQPRMMAALAEQLQAHFEDFSPSELALTLWSLAAGGGLSPAVVDAVSPRLPLLHLAPLDMVQLFQADCVSGGLLLQRDGGQLAERCRLESSGMFQNAPLSDTVVEVSDVLHGMGLLCQLGTVSGDGVTGIPLEVGVGGRAVVVELEGPGRYLLGNASERLTGAAVLRRRMLEAQGYTVVNVPIARWAKLRDEGSQRRFLCDLFFRQAGIGISGSHSGDDDE